jgi:hypothetical protein
MGSIFWQMVSSWTAIISVIVGTGTSAFFFTKTYGRMKKSEQVKMAHDIGNNIVQVENSIIQAKKDGGADEVKLRYRQYLNVWDWYSMLVNKGQITAPEILNYYKPTMVEDYKTIFKVYPELKQAGKYEEFVKLCEQYLNEKTKN